MQQKLLRLYTSFDSSDDTYLNMFLINSLKQVHIIIYFHWIGWTKQNLRMSQFSPVKFAQHFFSSTTGLL